MLYWPCVPIQARSVFLCVVRVAFVSIAVVFFSQSIRSLVLFLAMAELAHRALSLVISKHAGCLGSYAADKRARLCRAYELVEESEDRVAYLYSICCDL